MIMAIPKEEETVKRDLDKDYKGLTRERLIGMPKSQVESLVLDSCILDELEKDINNLDGVRIRMLLRRRKKHVSKVMDSEEKTAKN